MGNIFCLYRVNCEDRKRGNPSNNLESCSRSALINDRPKNFRTLFRRIIDNKKIVNMKTRDVDFKSVR